MVKYDLIIVAKSSSSQLIRITQNCIDSARQDNADLNIIVVETNNVIHHYPNCRTILYKGNFCYNKALNLGIFYAKGDVFILVNNDIVFQPGWSVIGELMKINGFESACALSESHMQRKFNRGEWIYEGYIIGAHITGWCIFAARSCIEKIGKLNEGVDFWYSDNIYADQIMQAGIRHGLFCNVWVNHITSATLRTIPASKQRQYSYGSTNKYKAVKMIMQHAG